MKRKIIFASMAFGWGLGWGFVLTLDIGPAILAGLGCVGVLIAWWRSERKGKNDHE